MHLARLGGERLLDLAFDAADLEYSGNLQALSLVAGCPKATRYCLVPFEIRTPGQLNPVFRDA